MDDTERRLSRSTARRAQRYLDGVTSEFESLRVMLEHSALGEVARNAYNNVLTLRGMMRDLQRGIDCNYCEHIVAKKAATETPPAAPVTRIPVLRNFLNTGSFNSSPPSATTIVCYHAKPEDPALCESGTPGPFLTMRVDLVTCKLCQARYEAARHQQRHDNVREILDDCMLAVGAERREELVPKVRALAERSGPGGKYLKEVMVELAVETAPEIIGKIREMKREREERYDCHAGPGTTEPACGGCVTCLHRVIEETEHNVRALKTNLAELQERNNQQAQQEALRLGLPRLQTAEARTCTGQDCAARTPFLVREMMTELGVESEKDALVKIREFGFLLDAAHNIFFALRQQVDALRKKSC